MDIGWRSLLDDSVHAWRSLRRAPGPAAAVVFTIAIAAGSNLALLSVLDRLLFRPPAGTQAPDRLRRVYIREAVWNGSASTTESFSYPDYVDFGSVVHDIGKLEAYATAHERTISELGRRVSVSYVSSGFFATLGVRPALGRLLVNDQHPPAVGLNEAVVSQSIWRTAYGSDPGIVGRKVTVDGIPVTIVGVAGGAFAGVDVDAVDFWLPLTARRSPAESPWWSNRQARFLSLIARLRPSGVPGSMDARLTTEYRRVHSDDPSADAETTILLAPVHSARGPRELLPSEQRNLSLVKRLSAISAAVLLIASVNCASVLMLAAIARRRQTAIRLAMGLSKARLARQLVLETILLGIAATSVAVIIAWWASTMLQSRLLWTIRVEPLPMDHRGLLTVVLVTVGAVAGAAVGPMVFLLRTAATAAIRQDAASGSPGDSRLRGFAIMGQTALSLALVSLSLVFLVTLQRDIATGLHFDRDRLIVVASAGRQPEHIAGMLARVRSLGFVERAANAVADVPPGRAMTRLTLETDVSGGEGALVSFNAVDTGYFATIGLRPVMGRVFTSDDGPGAEPAAIVTQSAAQTFWPGQPPLGRCAYVFGNGVCTRVVGVVPDIRWDLAKAPQPHFYVPLAQAGSRVGQVVLVRTRMGATAAHIADIERAFAVSDSAGTTPNVFLTASRLERQVRPLRAASGMMLVYAFVVFGAAAVGMFGRVSYEISQRTRELGVRAALGASPLDLVRLVVSSGTRLLAIGLVLGILLVAVSGRLMTQFVFGATAANPFMVAAAVIALSTTGIVAMLLAARRAAVFSPANALRQD